MQLSLTYGEPNLAFEGERVNLESETKLVSRHMMQKFVFSECVAYQFCIVCIFIECHPMTHQFSEMCPYLIFSCRAPSSHRFNWPAWFRTTGPTDSGEASSSGTSSADGDLQTPTMASTACLVSRSTVGYHRACCSPLNHFLKY